MDMRNRFFSPVLPEPNIACMNMKNSIGDVLGIVAIACLTTVLLVSVLQ